MSEQAWVGDVPGCRVNPLTPDDWPELRAARGQALSTSGDVLLAVPGEEQWAEARWRSTFETGTWVGAWVGRALVALARIEHDPTSSRRYIKAVWTRPEHRNRGIARHMIQWLLDHERRHGGHEVWVWLIPPNPHALHLYGSMGFLRTGLGQRLADGRWEIELRLSLDTLAGFEVAG